MNKIPGLALILCLLSAAASAQTGWNQDEAIGIVGELRESLDRIVAASSEGAEQPDAVQSKNSQAALVDIKVLIEELERLDLALAAGNGKVQTLARYQRISNLRYSVRDYAQDLEIRDEVRSEAEAAGNLLRELDLMYVE